MLQPFLPEEKTASLHSPHPLPEGVALHVKIRPPPKPLRPFAMLKALLNRLFGPSMSNALRTSDPTRWESSLLDRIKEMSPTDPLIGAKIAGKELAPRMLDAVKVDRGVHVESLMCAAGALAGYSCQAAVRAKNKAQGIDELAGLSVATTQDGAEYLFGDPLNKYLAESEMSVWSIAAGGAQACGCESILDLDDVFAHVANTVGSSEYGVPRLPAGHPVHEPPQAYLARLWPKLFPMVERFCPEPDHWPIAFALGIQELLSQTRSALEPCIALQVVMESAIPMSKVKLSEA